MSEPVITDSFRSFAPARGEHVGPPIAPVNDADIDRAAAHAALAFTANLALPPLTRADFLTAAADRIDALGDTLIHQAAEETALTHARLTAERARTTAQLRMFARLIQNDQWAEPIIDSPPPAPASSSAAAPPPTASPDLRRLLRPLGPVAVFGASNFPLAYSVAGGDTASALAAGCPVIVKGHAAHPLTGQLVADALTTALRDSPLHPATFAFLQSGGPRDVHIGRRLVLDPSIRAVGFTGSVAGGTAIASLAAARSSLLGPDPIPVFAEMGSINPIALLPGALTLDSAASLASIIAASAVNSVGQMCTCPGLLFLIAPPLRPLPSSSPPSSPAATFIDALAHAMAAPGPMHMLSCRTHSLLQHARAAVEATPGVQPLLPASSHASDSAVLTSATLYLVDADDFVRSPRLTEECFGPSLILVRCDTPDQLLRILESHLPGSLTASVFAAESDRTLARSVLDRFERLAGRLIYNGVPTGVQVSPAMVHSGPFPASNRPDASAVGATAIRRWCRPVCFQNVPADLLPAPLRTTFHHPGP